MTTVARARHADPDLLSTVRALFPGAEVGQGVDPVLAFRFVPNMRRARLLVPADAPRAAAGAVDRPSAGDTFRQRVVRDAVRGLLRVPSLAALLMPHTLAVGRGEPSLADHLSEVVGTEVRFSLAIGSRRANRKPVLNVHAVDGSEIGYAKVGLTPLANSLIDHEAATLAGLAGSPPRTFRVPRLLHHGRWRGSSVLLMESLRPSGRRRAARVPVEAMAELAARDGVRWLRVSDTDWVRRIETTGEELRRAGRTELHEVATRYLAAYGDLTLPFGRWHGDLGPWNMAWQGDTALIWDWERSAPHVPAGLDAVHFVCHPHLREVGDLPRARRVLATQGTGSLRAVLRALPDGPTRPDALIGAVVAGYLLSVATRFSADALLPDGEKVGRAAAWHLSVLRDQLDQVGE